MPRKKRKAASSDHLSTALEALRERPRPQLGLEGGDRGPPLGYVAGVGVDGREAAARAGKLRRSGKLRMAFNLSEGLCERARNAVWHLSGRIGLNLSSLTERTLEREVGRLEKKYNGGRPFPKRQGRLKGGPLRRPSRPHGRKTETSVDG